MINDAAVTGSPAAVVATETIMPDEEADVVAADDARQSCQTGDNLAIVTSL